MENHVIAASAKLQLSAALLIILGRGDASLGGWCVTFKMPAVPSPSASRIPILLSWRRKHYESSKLWQLLTQQKNFRCIKIPTFNLNLPVSLQQRHRLLAGCSNQMSAQKWKLHTHTHRLVGTALRIARQHFHVRTFSILTRIQSTFHVVTSSRVKSEKQFCR